MIALLQRVSSAYVDVAGDRVATIGSGLLVFLAVESGDDVLASAHLAERVLAYRVFPDDAGKMNVSVLGMHGALLVVPQFTLAADTNKGTRASFAPAAEPAHARTLFEHFVRCARDSGTKVECGRFGMDMKVSLVNEGPVTFWLEA